MQAHKLVLATCSAYFRHLFLGRGLAGNASCPAHPIVYIPDLSDEVLYSFGKVYSIYFNVSPISLKVGKILSWVLKTHVHNVNLLEASVIV
jgi:hypothetical protein